MDIAPIKEKKHKIVKNENTNNVKIKRFSSLTNISIPDYLKNYENSYSEKNKNDQMLYLIRRNINEINLNNHLLGGKRKQDKILSYKKKDYFIRNSIDVEYELLNKNENSKKLKIKKRFSKIKKDFTRNYSLDYGNIHKKNNFLNLKNIKSEKANKLNLKNNINNNANICITENSIINSNFLKNAKISVF